MIHPFSRLLMLTILLFCSCSKEPTSSSESDEKSIHQTLDQYQAAYNHADAQKLGSLWSKEATFSTPLTGEVIEGRDAIIEHYKAKFAKEEQAKIEVVHKKLTFTAPDEALEEGLINFDYPDDSAVQVAFKAAYIKEDGKWLIDEIREIELLPAPSNFEHLKDLTWLIGEWQDTDDNTEISFKGSWDKHKNFLIQHFDVKIFAQDELQGYQIIAWDEAEKVIRSWIFDSDGGFGEGIWKKSPEGWYVPTKYILSDGRHASATSVYERIKDDSYVFSSIDREVDDEMLSNLDPVQVQRVK